MLGRCGDIVMPVKVTQKSPNAIKDIIGRYGKGAEIAVGLPAGSEGASAKYPTGEALLDVSYRNEFGVGVPQRPFIRAGIRKNYREIKDLTIKSIKLINDQNGDIETACEAIGSLAASITKNHIVELKSPANSPATVAMKGFNNPLVETGLLNQSITYQVRKK